MARALCVIFLSITRFCKNPCTPHPKSLFRENGEERNLFLSVNPTETVWEINISQRKKKKPEELKNKIAFEMKKIALTKNTAQQNNSHHYQERNCLTKWNLSRCSTFPLYQLKSIPTSSTSKDSTDSSLQI